MYYDGVLIRVSIEGFDRFPVDTVRCALKIVLCYPLTCISASLGGNPSDKNTPAIKTNFQPLFVVILKSAPRAGAVVI